MSLILTGMDSTALTRFVQYKNRLYGFNGRNRLRNFDGTNWNFAGIAQDAFVPTVAAGAAGNLTGKYRYYVVPINSQHLDPLGRPVAGLPSTISAEFAAEGTKLVVSNIPATHVDPQVDYWQIYRNKAGYYTNAVEPEAQDFFLVATITVGTTSYTDDLLDDELVGSDIIRFNRAIPPTFKYATMFGERMFGLGFEQIATGSATLLSGATVDFSVALPDGVVGCWFRKSGDANFYRIITQNSSTQVVLDRNYSGSMSAAVYSIFRYPWEIYFSEFLDPEAWGPEGEAFRWKREVPGHEFAVGLIPHQGRLLIFCNTKIFAVEGKSPAPENITITPEPLFNGMGAVSGDAICQVDDEVYFMSYRGPARLSGGQIELLGMKLRTDWLESLTAAEVQLCAVGSDGNNVWFSFPTTGDTENRRIWRFERWSQTWWEERFENPVFFFNDDTNNGRASVCCYAQKNCLFQKNTGSLDGTSQVYTGTVTTGGTNNLVSTGAGFPTAGGGLEQIYVHIFRSDVYVGSRRIINNTATQLNWDSSGMGGGALSVLVGDTYMVGSIWWKWLSKTYHLPSNMKREAYMYIRFGRLLASGKIFKTDYVNGDQEVVGSLKGLLADQISKKFDVNQRNSEYAVLLESRNGMSLDEVHLESHEQDNDK